MGTNWSHRTPDDVPTSNWCECEHDLEVHSLEWRPGFDKCLDPDMYIRFHTLYVKKPLFTIVHITVEVVSTFLGNNPHLTRTDSIWCPSSHLTKTFLCFPGLV